LILRSNTGRLAVAYAVLLAFLFKLPSFAVVSICQIGGNLQDCLGIAHLLYFAVRPICLFVSALAIGWLLFARLRSIGFSIGWPIAALYWLLVSYPFAIEVSNVAHKLQSGWHWYNLLPPVLFFHFALGAYALFASQRPPRSWDAIWIGATACAAYATMLSVAAIVHRLAGTTPLALQLKSWLISLTSAATAGLPFRLALWIALAVFAVMLVLEIVRQTREARSA
jgi:hypothetical protein